MRDLEGRGLATKRDIDRNAWRTPPDWIARVRHALGRITFDPSASSSPEHWIAEEDNWHLPDDGRAYVWDGLGFCNPPYGRANGGIQSWTARAADFEFEALIMLIPPSVCSIYWHTHVWPLCSRVAFPRGRIDFLDPETGEPAGQNDKDSSFILWTDVDAIVRRFDEAFGEVGAVR